MRAWVFGLGMLVAGCLQEETPPPLMMLGDEIGARTDALTAAERRVRAGQIRDAAFAAGMEQGWMLAGIADAETNMSHCWSELTWACMGPGSPDCGGGPVVAGAGDGPCSDRQGGLGMFQFDAGTFDDTLAREGDRILSIAGNTQAAVDFVANMVIRSAYVDGVDNREQAIAWMNTVRVDGANWDAWIRTVTHYYNGCAPTYSCFSSRYAHYRDNTSGVYSEMGGDFWVVHRDWAAQYVHQTFPLAADPFPIPGGTEVEGYLEMRNTGMQVWNPGTVFLGTTEPRDAASAIAASDWVSPGRAATIDRVVAPGETGRFNFHVRAPDVEGVYPQFFGLVAEGISWFPEPAENIIQIRVEAGPAPEMPPPPPPEETPDAGVPMGPAPDAGGMTTPPPPPDTPPGSFREGLSGGCSVAPMSSHRAAPAPGSIAVLLLLALVLTVWRTRTRRRPTTRAIRTTGR